MSESTGKEDHLTVRTMQTLYLAEHHTQRRLFGLFSIPCTMALSASTVIIARHRGHSDEVKCKLGTRPDTASTVSGTTVVTCE